MSGLDIAPFRNSVLSSSVYPVIYSIVRLSYTSTHKREDTRDHLGRFLLLVHHLYLLVLSQLYVERIFTGQLHRQTVH